MAASDLTSGSGQSKHLRFAPQPTTAKDEVLEFLQQLEKVHQKEQQPNANKQNLPGGPPGLATASGQQQSPLVAPGQAGMLQPPPMGMPPPPPPGMWNAPFPPPPHPDFMLPPGMPPPPHGGPPPIGAPKGGPPQGQRGAPGQMYHSNKSMSTAGKTTIQAKPQMRSLQQEVVKFVPAQLRKKGLLNSSGSIAAATGAASALAGGDHAGRREGSGGSIGMSGNRKESGLVGAQGPPSHVDSAHKGQPPTKDDAYAQFMKEMEGLI